MHEDDRKTILKKATLDGLRTRLGNYIRQIDQLDFRANDHTQFINDNLPKIERLLEAVHRTIELIKESK